MGRDTSRYTYDYPETDHQDIDLKELAHRDPTVGNEQRQ